MCLNLTTLSSASRVNERRSRVFQGEPKPLAVTCLSVSPIFYASRHSLVFLLGITPSPTAARSHRQDSRLQDGTTSKVCRFAERGTQQDSVPRAIQQGHRPTCLVPRRKEGNRWQLLTSQIRTWGRRIDCHHEQKEGQAPISCPKSHIQLSHNQY